MSELIPITVAAIVLSIFSHRTSEYDPIHCRYGRQDRLWFGIMAVAMILFCGLRTQYNDTDNYEYIYNIIPENIGLFEDLPLKIGENPLFHLTNRFLVKWGFSTQSFLMFYSAISVWINLWFLRKYSCNIPLSIFLFVALDCYSFNMAAIKQCLAMALAMVAVDRALQKKYLSFALWILIATYYHPYALMYIVVPFLIFRPWSLWSILMMTVFAAAGMVMESMIGTLVDVTDLLGENYDAASFTGEGVNPFRVAVVAVPLLISFLTRAQIAGKHDRVQNLMVNLAMLNAEIMFVGLFGTANYFARLANYFLPFQALAMPWLLSHFEPRSRRLMTWAAIGGYGAFFTFSNAIMDSFDYHYARVTVWEYLMSLF